MNTLFTKIRLISDTPELNPLLEPERKARLTVYGVKANGEEEAIPPQQIRFSVTTLLASGGREAASVAEDGTVTPLAGGYVRADACCVATGLAASLKLVIRPFWHEYHKTLTYKLFLAMDPFGVPDAGLPQGGRDPFVYLDFEEAEEIIRRIDRMTCGIPKICYLVGWQRGGHDHLYPAFNEVDPRLKRKEDPTARDSLRRLIRKGREYHTAVSLHVNLIDAYTNSPLWNEYREKRLLKEEPDGSVQYYPDIPELQGTGVQMANVIQSRLWGSGEFARRFEELFALLPELRETHTIHIDNWRADPCPALGVTRETEEEALRQMFLWLRGHGLDVTSEGSFHGRSEPMVGLQPMSWWDVPYHPSEIPPSLYCGGRAKRSDSDPRFGDSIHIENLVRENQCRGYDPCDGILEEFALYVLTWQYLNSHTLLSFDGETAVYSDQVKAFLENGVPVVREGETVVRYGTTFFVPMLWMRERAFFYYSLRDACFHFRLPGSWSDVQAVDLYYVDRSGKEEPKPEAVGVETKNGILTMNTRGRTAYVVRPHGAERSDKGDAGR